ncbi:hypothetical protein I4U23_016034 [Adineta vaga]|nr:hypothetical protein I4U23_016034 [Adineta vaga]
MNMESLPNELHLLIFLYLHQFDIFHSFFNLNQRFQQMIEYYLCDIDLTQPSLSHKQFLLFIQKIIPIQGSIVRSLKLTVKHNLSSLCPHIHQLTGLQSLTIIGNLLDNKNNTFLVDALSLPTLSELSLELEDKHTLKFIATNASRELTKLIVQNKSYISFTYLDDIQPMPHIKCLTMKIDSPKTLLDIYKIMPNVVQLNLLISNYYHTEDVNLEGLPIIFEKLQIEIDYDKCYRANFELINNVFDLFKNQIHELTLIIRKAPEEFSNYEQFQSLMNNFTHLQICNYNILTIHQPDHRFSNIIQLPNSKYYSFFTLPKPKPLLIEMKQHSFSLDVNTYSTLKELFEYDDKFNNLKQLELNCVVKGYEKSHQYSIIAKIIAQSPHLDTIFIRSNDTQSTIIHLENLFPEKKYSNKIKCLTTREHTINDAIVSSSSSSSSSSDYESATPRSYPPIFHSTFFFQLSQVLSDLQQMTFICDKQFLAIYSRKNSCYLNDIRQHCPKLTHLSLDMTFLGKKVFQSFKRRLDQRIR